MELRHLRYFIAVAEQRSFSRAALLLHIAAPPLSRQIQQLEDELGMKLLRRDRRRVEITEAGSVFLNEARLVLAQSLHAINAVQVVARSQAGRIRVGIGAGLASSVQRVLIDHLAAFPEVQIELEDLLSGFQPEALLQRTIDIGFLRAPADSPDLESELLFREPIMVLVSSSHCLAKEKKVQLKDLAGEPLLLHDRSASVGMHDRVLELYHRAGIKPHIQYMKVGHCDDTRLALVAAGKGIYVGSGIVINHEIYGTLVTTIPLDEPGASIDVLMAWRKNEQLPTILRFLDSA